MANALPTHSNEGKIQRGLEHLGCAARNFVLIAKTVGLTRFMEGMNGVPGRHFSDAAAERMLEVLGEMYELQIDLDAVNGSSHPDRLQQSRCGYDRADDPPRSEDCRGRARPHLGFAGSSRNHSIDGAENEGTRSI